MKFIKNHFGEKIVKMKGFKIVKNKTAKRTFKNRENVKIVFEV